MRFKVEIDGFPAGEFATASELTTSDSVDIDVKGFSVQAPSVEFKDWVRETTGERGGMDAWIVELEDGSMLLCLSRPRAEDFELPIKRVYSITGVTIERDG